MGTFGFTLRQLQENPALGTQSAALGGLNTYVRLLAAPNYFLRPDRLCATLTAITTRYRNGAAHTELQPLSVVEDFIGLLLGSSGQSGAMEQLVAASEPVRTGTTDTLAPGAA
jgi:hypothetical protein